MLKTKVAAVIGTALGAATMAVSPAFAVGDGWNHNSGPSWGSTGDPTWLNRSVTVSGKVWDDGLWSTTVTFVPFAGDTPLYDRQQSRTADDTTNEWRPFVLDGHDIRGGITKVQVWTCVNGSNIDCKHSMLRRKS